MRKSQKGNNDNKANSQGGMLMIRNGISRLAIAAFAVAASASLAWGQAEPLRIGAINPYSGPLALYGDEVSRGYQLAIDAANAKGGVPGRKIELLRGDAS